MAVERHHHVHPAGSIIERWSSDRKLIMDKGTPTTSETVNLIT
jgi:hypothetical protein